MGEGNNFQIWNQSGSAGIDNLRQQRAYWNL